MSEEKLHQHHHHHHHHHHHEDDASRFKRLSLLSIERKKKLSKMVFKGLCVLAGILVFLAILAYTIG